FCLCCFLPAVLLSIPHLKIIRAKFSAILYLAGKATVYKYIFTILIYAMLYKHKKVAYCRAITGCVNKFTSAGRSGRLKEYSFTVPI
ncbi:MAG: hypothetical protein ACRC38_09875, partial [Plesiomonas sp.]